MIFFKINLDNSLRNTGFTLAEVLITLGIIGIVANMTIPTLIANTQKAQYVATLKKAYTQFNQVLVKMSNDYGCPGDLKCMGEWSGGNTTSTLLIGEIISSYFKVIKNCKNSTNQDCMASRVNYKYGGKGAVDTTMNQMWAYKFITVEGVSFFMYSSGNNCGSNLSNGKFGYLTQTCGNVSIDINGPNKGPNYWGRDIFNFAITNGKGPLLYPRGSVDEGNTGTWQNSSANGCTPGCTIDYYCSARIIENNWEMDY